MKIRQGPDIVGAICFGIPSGLGAYAFLRSCHPYEGNFISGLVYVIFAFVWILIFCLALRMLFIFKSIEISIDALTEKMFVLGLPVRTKRISFSDSFYVDAHDFKAGFLVGKTYMKFFVAGPKVQIQISLRGKEAENFRDEIKLAQQRHQADGDNAGS